MRNTLTTLILILALGLCTTAGAQGAQKVQMDAALNKTVLLTDETNQRYLRVRLTGFEMERQEERPPVNLSIVLDKSGSMSGEKIRKAREAAIMALRRLTSKDIISIVVYDHNVRVALPATRFTDPESVFQIIRSIEAGGNTALFGGVSKGAEEVRKFLSDDAINRMILLSDGLANVGPSSPAALGDLGASLLHEGITVSTIGLGTDYNEDLMAKLASESDGNTYFAENASDLPSVFDREFGRALSVVAQEVQATIRFAPGIRPVRIIGREGEIDGQTVHVFIHNLYSSQAKEILVEFEAPRGETGDSREVASVMVEYRNMKTEVDDRLASDIRARYSDSPDQVEASVNREVSISVVKQLAAEKNILAMQLRDKGQVEEARNTLLFNEGFLKRNAAQLDAPELEEYGDEQKKDSENLAPGAYKIRRKEMREQQLWMQKQ